MILGQTVVLVVERVYENERLEIRIGREKWMGDGDININVISFP
jgi:hypothetical protein